MTDDNMIFIKDLSPEDRARICIVEAKAAIALMEGTPEEEVEKMALLGLESVKGMANIICMVAGYIPYPTKNYA